MTPGPVVREGIAHQRALDGAGFASHPIDLPYEDIAHLARHVCGSEIALVAVTAPGGQMLRACTGLSIGDIADMHAFCAHALQAYAPIEITDMRGDVRFANHRLVASEPGLRFCAGIALAGRDVRLGSLCVLDRYPRTLTAAQRDGLVALAHMTTAMVDAQRSIAGGPMPAATGTDMAQGAWMALPLSGPSRHRVFDDRYAVAIVELDGGSVPVPAREWVMQRIQDIAESVLGHDDVLSRDGPGELLVVFAHAAQASAALERIGAASDALPGRPRIAIGAAIGSHDRDAMEDVFLEAESALYRARLREGPRIVFAPAPLTNA